MSAWRWLLWLVIVAALAAFGWHWVAADPGQVLIHLRGWTVKTTVLTAVLIVVAAVILLLVIWRLVRWPTGAVGRRQRRARRKELLSGLIQLAEGHYGTAQRSLAHAAAHVPQKGVAWLAAARAAARRGDTKTAGESLDKAARVLPRAARSERARVLRRAGRASEAVALLAPQADHGKLTPAGWLELVRAAEAAGEPARARAALEPLRKSAALDTAAQSALEARILTAAIAEAADAAALKKLWSSLAKSQRRRPELVAAYAQRCVQLEQPQRALDELRGALKRQWSPTLVRSWGSLDCGRVETRLRAAESWLDKHSDDVALLVALGRLSAHQGVHGKAREYLRRALDTAPDADIWEALGDVYAAQDNMALSHQCYRNALRAHRGEQAQPLPSGHDGTRSPAGSAEASGDGQRDAHGMPHGAVQAGSDSGSQDGNQSARTS